MMLMRFVLLLLASLFLVATHPAAMADNAMNHAVSESGQTGGHDTTGSDEKGQTGVPCCQGMTGSQAGDAHCPADCAGLIPFVVVMASPPGPAAIGEAPPEPFSPVPQSLLKPPIPV
ncbi:MAG: hypothetical protein R3D65_09605 [Zhengella sp.]|uniref:hypothetical protein n=1 Tax=Zhengella sp. TaxID=2282762 RepID=UPI0035280CB8